MLRLPVAIDLDVTHFNQLAEHSIVILGVLMENTTFHDSRWMFPTDFLHHDGGHKYVNDRQIADTQWLRKNGNMEYVKLSRSDISPVIRDAYRSFSSIKWKNANQHMLFQLLFFQITHENFAIDKKLHQVMKKVEEGVRLGGKHYGFEKTTEADALAKCLDEKDLVLPIFAQFYQEIQTACVEERLFDPQKAWGTLWQ